tara:strand:+ start:44 stop:313 length:270 start_codon:yes stop_codon:yes gene_type:complete
MRYSKIVGTEYTTAVCTECNKQFRHTNKSLVKKLMDLHFKKNHPDASNDEENFNLKVKSFNNNNTTQFSHTLFDDNSYGDTIKEILKNK